MLARLNKIIARAYDKKIDASGLALFRITFCLVQLGEVFQLYYFRHLVYDKIPFVESAEIDFAVPLICWMIALVFLTLGLFTRPVAIINYILSLTLIGTIDTYEYHMFYLYVGVNFLLIFLNLSKVNSIDRLREKLKYSTARFAYEPPRTVSVLNYYAVILVAIGFVYFDSVFFKFTSHNWMTGIGMWLPVSLPQVTHLNVSPLLNVKWVMLGLGYLTLVFEASFIFLFWRKKWRWTLFTIGVGLHIGILIVFPLPWFGFGVTSFYLLMVPVGTWRKISGYVKRKKPALTFYFDEECPLCARTKIILSHFDVFHALEFKSVQAHGVHEPLLSKRTKDELLNSVFSVTSKGKVLEGIDTYSAAFLRIPVLIPVGILMRIPGIRQIANFMYRGIAGNRITERCNDDNCGYTPPRFPSDSDSIKLQKNFTLKQLKIGIITTSLIFFSFLQLAVTYNSDLIRLVKRKVGISNSAPEKIIQKATNPVRAMSKVLFGICHHPVFMDAHFKNYNHIIGVEAVDQKGVKRWLPMIDQNGMPGFYAYGFNWVKWTFRVDGPRVDQTRLTKGIRDFSTFWAKMNGIPLDKVTFNIYVKKIDVPYEWKKDHLNTQIAKEWHLAGTAHWEGKTFVTTLEQIEDL